jgi:hypothetical protein
MQSFAYQKHGCRFECYPNEEKRIVYVKLYSSSRSSLFPYLSGMEGKWYKDVQNSRKSIAKCHPDDKFDAMRGASVAANRIISSLLNIQARFFLDQLTKTNKAILQVTKLKFKKEELQEVKDYMKSNEPNEACIV